MALSWDMYKPEGDSVYIPPVGCLKGADDECNEVGAHHHRVGERDGDETIFKVYTFNLGRV